MIKRTILTLAIILTVFTFSFSQIVTANASLKGDNGFIDYVNNNVKYPIIAIENNIEGKVEFSFIVTKEGCIDSIEITSDTDPMLNKAVIKVLKKTACNWNPALSGDNPVSVNMSSFVNFELHKKKKKKKIRVE